MTAREDFSDDEWYRLRSAPWQAAMGVVEVDPSGGIAEGREMEAVEAELAAAQFDEGLIGLVTRDLLDLDAAVIDQDVPSAGPTAAVSESSSAGEEFPDQVIVEMGEVRRVLDAKAPAGRSAWPRCAGTTWRCTARRPGHRRPRACSRRR